MIRVRQDDVLSSSMSRLWLWLLAVWLSSAEELDEEAVLNHGDGFLESIPPLPATRNIRTVRSVVFSQLASLQLSSGQAFLARAGCIRLP